MVDVYQDVLIQGAAVQVRCKRRRTMHVPPFECVKCGERVYVLVPPSETLPRRWQCDCGRVNEIQSSERAAGCLLGSKLDDDRIAKVEHHAIIAGTDVRPKS